MAITQKFNLLKLLSRNCNYLQKNPLSVGLYKNLKTFSSNNYDHKLFDKMPNTTEFPDKPILNPSRSIQIEKQGDKICRLVISADPNSNLAPHLSKIGDLTLSPTLVTEVLKRLSNAGMLALAFFRWAETQNGFFYTSEMYQNLIEALGKIKQFKIIWDLVDDMRKRGVLTKDIFNIIMRRYARARKVKEVIETLEKMRCESGFKLNTLDYNSFFDTLSKSKHVMIAYELFVEMTRRKKFAFSPDLRSYTILLEGFSKEKDMTMLKQVFDEMRENNFEPDVFTFGILINAFFKIGSCEEAIKIFDQMKMFNCKPNAHIFCTLINGLGSEGRLDEALKYFELSKNEGIVEIPIYNAIIGSYCRVLRFEDAFNVLKEMEQSGSGPNTRTYDIILNHLIKDNQLNKAYKIFREMSDKAGAEPQINTYTMIISMFCANNRLDMALKVWKEISEKGVAPCMHMFCSVINGLCSENRAGEACEYFEEMLDKGIRPPSRLFGNLKEVLIRTGQKELAFEMGCKLEKLRRTPLNG